jgi:NAD(P)-dependent dehydrogenase (short-subunit alcohol dehydrogenase family)
MSVDGNTIAVVGAGGAIGHTVCAALLGAGAKVVGFDRMFGRPLAGLDAHQVDCADFSRVVEAFNDHLDTSQVDALVNIAGLFEVVDFVETEPNQWHRMINANLITAMTTCRAILPAWLERGSGSIVNFASTAGEFGSIRPSAAYAAAKGGVIAFSKSLAREVSPHGIRVNVVSPGPVDTDMLQAGSDAAHREATARTLLGRLGRPEDIAAAVLYLAGSTSNWITGEVLRVNGGSLI